MDNPVLNAILSRTSIRSYGKESPTDEQIDMMIRAAMAAPSACDTRPWSFVVCRETKWFNAPCAIVVCGKRTVVPVFELDGVWAQDCAAAAVRFPVKGRHICEFMFDENNVVKCYHPGHDVTDITEVKC